MTSANICRRRVGKGAERRAHHFSGSLTVMVGTLRFVHPTSMTGSGLKAHDVVDEGLEHDEKYEN
jgi:hypothetical protein